MEILAKSRKGLQRQLRDYSTCHMGKSETVYSLKRRRLARERRESYYYISVLDESRECQTFLSIAH